MQHRNESPLLNRLPSRSTPRDSALYDSLILRTISRLMMPLLLLLSIFMLLRGHNLPGGGFIGGLLASSAIILQIVAFGPKTARRILPVNYLLLAAFGVFFGAIWGLPALFAGLPYMQAFWLPEPIPGVGKIGTPVLFDIGVYFTVIGVTTKIALLLVEEPILFPLPAMKTAPAESRGGRMIILLAIAIGSLFGGATYLMLRRSVVKLILGLIMLSHGVNLLIFTMGDGVRRGAPPLVDANGQPPAGSADPLVQALILTAIVISFGFTAFVLALAYRSNQAVGSDDLDDLSTTDRL